MACGDLAERFQLDESQVEIQSMERKTWANPCLELLPALNQGVCSQGVTPGWRVTLLAAGKAVVYHTDLDAQFGTDYFD